MKIATLLVVGSCCIASVGALLPSKLTKYDRQKKSRARGTKKTGMLRRLAVEDCDGNPPPFLLFWDELNDQEIIAAARLGFCEEMWNDSDYPNRFHGIKWSELAEDDRAKFELLGYDHPTWEGFYSAVFYGKLEHQEAGVQQAALDLGYDKETWNTCYHNICTEVQQLSWTDLNDVQRSAAQKMGYECHTWEYFLGPDNLDSDDCTPPNYERSWNGLTNAAKKAVKNLGYNETTWDNDSLLPPLPKTWAQLTDRQKEMLGITGYTEASYNVRDFARFWDQLPSTIQSSASNLNLSAKTWDTCFGPALSKCTHLGWNELTFDQKKSVGSIGFNCYDY
mmetsp:Transcript_11195/g.24215  ORF Transcript_11195/g.24215 Transcript_11195/m.24215 type:complete len:336 (-) Transcript_11195:209-1216(-)